MNKKTTIMGNGGFCLPSGVKKLIIWLLSLYIVFGFFALAQSSEAATHYVDQNHPNASDLNLGTEEELPWKTLKKATDSVKAGDTVIVKAGIYIDDIDYADNPFNPAHTGTSGNPITFQASPPLAATIKAYGIPSTHTYNAWLVTNVDYIVLDGFRIVGSVQLSHTSHSVIKNCEVTEGLASTADRSYLWAIHLGLRATHCTVQNNYVHDLTPGLYSSGDNTGVIQLYYNATYNTLLNNTVDCASASKPPLHGFSTKGGQNDYNTYDYNVVKNCGVGFYEKPDSGETVGSTHNTFYQNIVMNYPGSAGSAFNFGKLGAYQTVYNNTVYNVYSFVAGNITTTNLQSFNNLVQKTSRDAYWMGYTPTTPGAMFTYINYNGYYDIATGEFATLSGVYATSLADWQTKPGSPDANSVSSNPNFINASGNFSRATDFKRISYPADGRGDSYASVMGAYITGNETIGYTPPEETPNTPPTISGGSPTDALSVGTTQTAMSVTTDENATCRWSTSAGASYSSMTNTFSTTGGTSHSTTITGLSNGQTYNRYIRCQDTAGNPTTSDYVITFSVASSEGTNITLYPSQDTFININTETNINNTTLNTYTWPTNQIANAILMKFNLSSIPSNANIQDAKLYLYLTAADTNTSYPTYANTLHRIINHNPNLSLATGYTYDGANPWTASSCCYNNTPLAQADISSAYDTQSINKTLGFKSWNAAQLIKDWLSNPSTNYGLLINSDPAKPADTYRTFASSEYANASYRPYLEIAYTLSDDTIPPAAPTGLAVN